jgi:hypothetical protein
MRLRVIVRSQHEFGAGVQLLGGEYEPVLDRGTISVDVGAPAPAVSLIFHYQALATEIAVRSGGGQRPAFDVTFEHAEGQPEAAADLELNTGYRYVLGSGPVDWSQHFIGDGLWGHFRATVPVFEGRTGYPFMLSSTSGACLQPEPAAIATVHLASGDIVIAARGEAPSPCDGASVLADLPAAGRGAVGADSPSVRPSLVALAGVVLLAVGAGLPSRPGRNITRKAYVAIIGGLGMMRTLVFVAVLVWLALAAGASLLVPPAR